MHAGTLFGRMGDIQREPINSGTQHLYPSATIAERLEEGKSTLT